MGWMASLGNGRGNVGCWVYLSEDDQADFFSCNWHACSLLACLFACPPPPVDRLLVRFVRTYARRELA